MTTANTCSSCKHWKRVRERATSLTTTTDSNWGACNKIGTIDPILAGEPVYAYILPSPVSEKVTLYCRDIFDCYHYEERSVTGPPKTTGS